MNIGSSANDLGYLFVGLLALLFIIPLFLLLCNLLTRLLSHIVGISLGWLMLMVLAVSLFSLLIAISLYMDTRAQPLTGTVTSKSETIKIKRKGDWKYEYYATVEYLYEGETGTARLQLSERRFDELTQAASTELKLVPLYRTIVMVRLAAIQTAEWIATPLRWFGIGALLLFAGWLLAKVMTKVKSKIVWGILGALGLVAAAAIPTYLTYQAWQSAEDLASRPLRAEATVTAIQRITNLDYFPCDSSNCSDTSFDARQPFDIVQMTYQPANYSEPVLAADSADAGSIITFLGDKIPIAYAADQPRNVQIIDATHSHHWRNALFFVWYYMAVTILFYALSYVAQWGMGMIGQKLMSRRMSKLPK